MSNEPRRHEGGNVEKPKHRDGEMGAGEGGAPGNGAGERASSEVECHDVALVIGGWRFPIVDCEATEPRSEPSRDHEAADNPNPERKRRANPNPER